MCFYRIYKWTSRDVIGQAETHPNAPNWRSQGGAHGGHAPNPPLFYISVYMIQMSAIISIHVYVLHDEIHSQTDNIMHHII